MDVRYADELRGGVLVPGRSGRGSWRRCRHDGISGLVLHPDKTRLVDAAGNESFEFTATASKRSVAGREARAGKLKEKVLAHQCGRGQKSLPDHR